VPFSRPQNGFTVTLLLGTLEKYSTYTEYLPGLFIFKNLRSETIYVWEAAIVLGVAQTTHMQLNTHRLTLLAVEVTSIQTGSEIIIGESAQRTGTPGINNQSAKLQFFDQESVFIDRVRLQPANGIAATTFVRDFDVQVSSTNSNDAAL
jgi:hypothetical protein